VAGLAVVFVAIMLDRATSAATKVKKSFVPPTEKELKIRKFQIIAMAIFAVVTIYLSRSFLWAAIWPENINIYKQVAAATNAAVEFATTQLYILTIGFK
jgi:glycine betaine/proline transport system permease protein